MSGEAVLQVIYRDPRDLTPYKGNARTHSPEQIAQIAASIREFGFASPILLKDDETQIGAGHARREAALLLGLTSVPTITLHGLSESKWRAFVLADNKLALNAGWDEAMLAAELQAIRSAGIDLDLTGFDAGELDVLIGAGDPDADPIEEEPTPPKVALADRFGIAPFSVLNAREGWWQDRKRAWLALGIRSEVGRGENLLQMPETMLEPDPAKRAEKGKSKGGNLTFVKGECDPASLDPVSAKILESGTGTSIFDPVLCELAYRWWSPPGGLVLDPFAGGSVRGIVAVRTGRTYVGVDLRAEQVEANRAQAEQICRDDMRPDWICADSRTIDALEIGPADMIFSCPPYADLEVYSDDPADLSTLAYDEFRQAYFEIIAKACAKLKADRFACFVVGDVRDPKGAYRNFVGDTVEAFRAAGLAFYNEAILVTACGSLALRAGRQFATTRKLGKTHQNVLVFVKGDPRKATQACGEPEFGDIEDGEADADDPDAEFGEPL